MTASGAAQPGLPAAPLTDAWRALEEAQAALATDPGESLTLARRAQTGFAVGAEELGGAGAWLALGQAHHALAQLPEAARALDEAAGRWRHLERGTDLAATLLFQARVARETGQRAAALTHLDEALRLGEELGNRALQADVLNQQAALARGAGQGQRALDLLHSALDIRLELGDQGGAAKILNNLGQVHLSQGAHGRALEAMSRAYDLLKAVDDPSAAAYCLMNTAHVHDDLGDHDAAWETHQRALGLGRGAGLRRVELSCLINLGDIALHRRDEAQAAALFEEALTLAQNLGLRAMTGIAHHGLGQVSVANQAFAVATDHHQRALALSRELGDPQAELDALLGLGAAHLGSGAVDAAHAAFGQAEALAGTAPSRAAAEAQAGLAETWARQGAFERSLAHLRGHVALREHLHTQERTQHTRRLTVEFDLKRAQHETELYRLRTDAAQQAYEDAEALVRERTGRLAEAQIEIVTRLANAAEFRDDLTGEHTLRVGHVAALLARELGRPTDEVELLRLAARLHDVGKIGISDLILLKPGPLSPEEYELMKTHTLIGSQIVGGGDAPLLRMAEEIALSHHERWDGGGYPHGLREDAIPLSARLVAVADVYDALSHSRPYKRAWSTGEVLAEVQRQSGRHFQPEIVAALLDLHGRGELPLQGRLDGLALPVHLIVGMTHAPSAGRLADRVLQAQLEQLQAQYRHATQRAKDMEVAAFTDALTTLPNRRAFDEALESERAAALRQDSGLCVVLLDLDGFKRVNDAQGHSHGDALLRTLATALQAALHAQGTLYRIGGDEFALLARSTSPDLPDAVAAGVTAATLSLEDAGFPGVTVSSGWATFPQDGMTADELLRRSNQRMYQDKRRRSRLRSALHLN